MGVVIKYINFIKSWPFATRFDIFVCIWLKAKAVREWAETKFGSQFFIWLPGIQHSPLADIFYITLKGRS